MNNDHTNTHPHVDDDLQTEVREYHLLTPTTYDNLRLRLCLLEIAVEEGRRSRKQLQEDVRFCIEKMEEYLQSAPLRLVYASTRWQFEQDFALESAIQQHVKERREK